MEELERAIENKGEVLAGDVLKVGSFLNHNMDVKLLGLMADEIVENFKGFKPTKVLTVEASGIALATLVAERLGVEMVFAKKSRTSNVTGQVYSSKCFSFTHQTLNELSVPKTYINKSDVVLIIDDFLANGEAINALLNIVNQANATLCGAGIAVEKGFQHGGDKLREKGLNLLSLAIVESMENGKITFRK